MDNPPPPHHYQQVPRQVPANDLDLQMAVTNPAWQELSIELRKKLLKPVKDDKYEELAGVLAIYTRDLRLGNLSAWNGEYDYVCYYLELSVDLLEAELPEACIVALSKALARLEPSSSKGGFLRKLFNTVRSESINKSLEPEKKRAFGSKPKNKEW